MTRKEIAAQQTARKWGALALVALLLAPLAWCAAYQTGFQGNAFHAAFELVASSALALTVFGFFAAAVSLEAWGKY